MTVIRIDNVNLDISPNEPMSIQETLALAYYGRRMHPHAIGERLGVSSHEALRLACSGALKAERILEREEV